MKINKIEKQPRIINNLICIICNKEPKCEKTTGKTYSYCIQCRKEINKKWYRNKGNKLKEVELKSKKEKAFNYKIRSTYSIDLVEFKRLIELQNNKCAICRLEMIKPNIDHNHKTGEIRGLLCFSCNLGLGHFKDSIEYLDNAKDYLNKK